MCRPRVSVCGICVELSKWANPRIQILAWIKIARYWGFKDYEL